MATQRAVVIELCEASVSGGYAGESHPRFHVAHNLFLCSDLRIYLNELFQRIFVKQLQTKAKLHNVVIVEKFNVAREVRDYILTVLLRDFHVPSVTMQPELFMAMLSSGCSSGIVVDIGRNSSQAMCFVNHRPLVQTWKEATVGVVHAQAALHGQLAQRLESEVDPAAVQSVFSRVMYDNTGGVQEREAGDTEISPAQGLSQKAFTLPVAARAVCLQGVATGYSTDGDCVDENGGVAGLILQCLKACNHDVRLKVSKHIVFIGEGAVISGLCEAVCAHATAQAAENAEYADCLKAVVEKLPEQRLQVLPSAFPRSQLAWVGGSVFASLKESKSAFVTLQDILHADASTTGPVGGAASKSSALTAPAPPPATQALPAGYLLRAPDWQSLNQQDWVFCRTAVL